MRLDILFYIAALKINCMPFNESPCFYICYGTTRPTIDDLYIFHLCTPSWFAKLRQNGAGANIDIIKHMGPEPDKDVLQHSMEQAAIFVRDYFAGKI